MAVALGWPGGAVRADTSDDTAARPVPAVDARWLGEPDRRRLRVRGKAVPLRWMRRIVERFAGRPVGLDGRAEFELFWEPRARAVWGTMTVTELSVRFGGAIPAIERGRLQLTLPRVAAARWSVSGAVGEGRLEATGIVATRRGAAALHARAKVEEVPLVSGSAVGAFSGEVRLTATRDRSRWNLSVAVESGELAVPEEAALSELHPTSPPADVVFVSDVDRRRRRRSVSYAVSIRTVSPIRLRGAAGSRGNLSLSLALENRNGAAALTGVAELRSGVVELYERRWEVVRAGFAFEGRRPPDPAVDVRLSREAESATLYIDVAGTARTPRVRLSASPAIYDQAQLLSLVQTGAASSKQSDESLETQALAAVSAALSRQLGRAAQVYLPIDTVRVGTREGVGEEALSSVTLGKWLSDRVFLAYRRKFDAEPHENINEATLEYGFAGDWLLEGIYGDRGQGSLDLLWSIRF